MNRIFERTQNSVALAPMSQSAGSSNTSTYISGSGMGSIDFIATFGALAAGKKLTMEVYAADDTTGTNAAKVGELVYTAPTGGATSGIATLSVEVKGDQSPYYAVKVTNDAAAAVLIAVTAVGDAMATPENANTMVV